MIGDFGRLPDGTTVKTVTVSDGRMELTVCEYGCTVMSLKVPDRNGNLVDVALGYPSIQDYMERSGRMGATIGRFANRISDACFSIDGNEYKVTMNRGKHHIHGGNKGFDKHLWSIDEISESKVGFSRTSEDMEEGYPGKMDISVEFELKDGGLHIAYKYRSDRKTVCNLTNHSYFNLAGEGRIDDHLVTLNAGRYTPLDDEGIPTGEIAEVSGHRDLRAPAKLGDRRFDDNFLCDGEHIATVSCERTGIAMDVFTDLPAFQFYTADGLKDCPGKYGERYGARSGLCIETQFCPDSPNRPEFPSCHVEKDTDYRHRTEYRFRTVG